MKERPILFSAPMVRAILEGRKTQTRRVIKLNVSGRVKAVGSPKNWHLDDQNAVLACHYGQPGDRLWVKETHARYHDKGAICCPHYFADGPLPTIDQRHDIGLMKVFPSIHMPRWASRITLEITDVRIQRLKDISEDDAREEGGTWTDNGPREWARQRGLTFEEANPVNGWKEGWSHVGNMAPGKCLQSAKTSFGNLWESMNGTGSWDANPWVWVIEFKMVQP